MKQKLILLLAASLTLAGYSQQIVTNDIPWAGSPIFDMLGKSNLLAGTYVTHDTTDKTWGGGVFLGYKLSEMLVPIFRLDYVRNDAYAVSGNIQLQLPVDLAKSTSHPEGLFRITPLTFAGIATSWNNNNNVNDGNVIGIFGIGVAISFKEVQAWWLPKGIAADYERWTGSGFNDNQIRVGPFWKF